MARANECNYKGEAISVEEALDIRDATSTRGRKSLGFECLECGKAVRPHKAGGSSEAHFEHLRRNPECQLSDPR